MKRSLSILAAAALLVGLMASPVAAKPPTGGGGNTNNNGSCPSSTGAFLQAPNVGAYSTGTTNRTYFFQSWVDENPVAGVPGLVGYCVYTNQVATSGSASVPNWNWTLLKGKKSFVFARIGGNQNNNVALDGSGPTQIGTTTFAISPTSEIILLHINDPAQCAALYGGLSPSTCWVLPSEAPPSGPVCDAAASGDLAAYNDIPNDAVDCGPPSEAFEAQSASEFGDEVTLAGSGNLQSLTVLFNSYACEDHPLWNNSDCYTSNNAATFTHTITANIYGPSVGGAPGALLATATQTFTNIPYRPSADTTNCGATGAFLNPISGNCEFSKKVLLTFTAWNANPALSGDVVWTVAYNTTHYGYTPIGEGAACYGTTAGCPYDSLNVGTKTFVGAPYAGGFVDASDAFLYSSWTGAYCDNGSAGVGILRQDASCWLGFQPLGKIVLAP